MEMTAQFGPTLKRIKMYNHYPGSKKRLERIWNRNSLQQVQEYLLFCPWYPKTLVSWLSDGPHSALATVWELHKAMGLQWLQMLSTQESWEYLASGYTPHDCSHHDTLEHTWNKEICPVTFTDYFLYHSLSFCLCCLSYSLIWILIINQHWSRLQTRY